MREQIKMNSENNEKSLIEMGGSKKRKRESFEDIDRSNKIIKFEENYQTTIPDGPLYNTRSRKRRLGVLDEFESYPEGTNAIIIINKRI